MIYLFYNAETKILESCVGVNDPTVAFDPYGDLMEGQEFVETDHLPDDYDFVNRFYRVEDGNLIDIGPRPQDNPQASEQDRINAMLMLEIAKLKAGAAI